MSIPSRLIQSKNWALLALGLALLAAMVLVLMRAGPLAAVRVTVTQADEGVIAPALFGVGVVEARRSHMVGPVAAGRVLRVAVDVGDSVHAGQVLAEMDPVDTDQRIASLDASLARATSAIAVAEAQSADAQARKALALSTTQRYVDLAQKGFVSNSSVEAKQQEQSSADAVGRAAGANLLAARQDVERIRSDRTALQQQRQNLRLLAAQDGVVMARDAEPGSTVVAGQAVLRVVDVGSLWIKTRFDQGRSGALRTGLPARIVLRSAPGQPLPGKVARVELQSDSVTEEKQAYIRFDALPPGLTLGELAEVTVDSGALPPTLLLPNAAIQRRAGSTGVWVLENDAQRFVPVQLGQSSLEGQVQVLQGIKRGDTVVVHSEKEISEGTRIQVVSSLVKSLGKSAP
jgi:HlyD family secretion protein